ncbi:MAG: PIN domain nuclease [Acidimicrobiia bacterium]
MALSERVVADTSVLTRVQRPEVDTQVAPAIVGGLIHTCAIVRLEVMRGLQSRARWRIALDNLRELPEIPITAETWMRAEEVQGLLVSRSHHTAVKIADLVIAAVAEIAGLPVIHYDRDFDLIAEVTGQDARWVVPKGSID